MNVPRRSRNPMPARLTASPSIEEVTLTGRRSWPTGTAPVALVPTGTTETVDTTADPESFRAAKSFSDAANHVETDPNAD